jgi:hypothetical protein
MTPSEFANKIAEEVFRTIERERAIVKAEIVDVVEKVLAQDASRSTADQKVKLGEWKRISKEELAAQQRAAQDRLIEAVKSCPGLYDLAKVDARLADCGRPERFLPQQALTRRHDVQAGEVVWLSKEELEWLQARTSNWGFQLGEWKAVNAPGASVRNATLPKSSKD